MSTHQRQAVSLALILAAVAFGMVLAGGLDFATPILAQDSGPISPQGVMDGEPAASLPGFANLAEAVEPAVVSVQASTIQQRPQGRRGLDPFEFFFGPDPRRRQDPRQQDPRQEQQQEPQDFRSESGGSGFVISADGLVVTNVHVIQDADSVTVRLQGREYEAEVRGTDPATDLALLKVDVDRPLQYLALGDSEELRSGDWVMAVGDPLGLDKTVTIGVVSAKGRSIGISNDASFENFIQTDAAINFGNSGGPLINLRGEVIGINTAINYGAENIGFAVPVNTLKGILPQLRDEGTVRRGYIGVSIQDVDFDIAEAFGLDQPTGVLVTQVIEGQPAEKAGLEHGDILLEADGRTITSTRQLIDYVSAQGPGASVELEVLRNGDRSTRTITLGERDTEGGTTAEPEAEETGSIDWMGLRYQDLNPGLRQMHGIPEDVSGVWITNVDASSPLWDEGVRNNGAIYVITEVNGTPVGTVEAFEEQVEQAPPGSRLRLFIRRFVQGQEVQPQFAFPRVP